MDEQHILEADPAKLRPTAETRRDQSGACPELQAVAITSEMPQYHAEACP